MYNFHLSPQWLRMLPQTMNTLLSQQNTYTNPYAVQTFQTTKQQPKGKLKLFGDRDPMILQNINAETNEIIIVVVEDANLLDEHFQLKPSTITNFCIRFINPITQKYYQCQTCCLRATGTSFNLLCQTCFNSGDHTGHTYTTSQTSSISFYCDCGRSACIKPTGFCPHHGDHIKIQSDIPQQDRYKFISIFGYLIDSVIYLKNPGSVPDYTIDQDEQIDLSSNEGAIRRNILNIIFDKLTQLNEQSVHYNRLTAQLLCTKSSYIQQLQKNDHSNCQPFKSSHNNQSVMHTYFCILIGNGSFTQMKRLIHYMCSQKQTKKRLIKLLSAIAEEIQPIDSSIYFKEEIIQLIDGIKDLYDIVSLQQLADEGFYGHKIFSKSYQKLSILDHLNRKLRNCPQWGRGKNLNADFKIKMMMENLKIHTSLPETTKKILKQICMIQVTVKDGTFFQPFNAIEKSKMKKLEQLKIQYLQAFLKSKIQGKQLFQVIKFLSNFIQQLYISKQITKQSSQYFLVMLLALYPNKQTIEQWMNQSTNEWAQKLKNQQEILNKEEQIISNVYSKTIQYSQEQKSEEKKNTNEIQSKIPTLEEQKQLQNNQGDQGNQRIGQRIEQNQDLSHTTYKQLEETIDDLPKQMVGLNRLMLKLLSIASGGDFQSLYFGKYLQNTISKYCLHSNQQDHKSLMSVLKQKMSEFFYWMCLHTQSICYYQEQPLLRKDFIVFATALISWFEVSQPERLKQYVSRIWKSMLCGVDLSIPNVVDYFLRFSRQILKSDAALISLKNTIKYQFKNYDETQSTQEKELNKCKIQSQQQINYMKLWLETFLIVEKNVSRETLIYLKKNGFVEFGKKQGEQKSELMQILQIYCNYVQDQSNQFVIKPQYSINEDDTYSILLFKFPCTSDPYDFQEYYKCQRPCRFIQGRQNIQSRITPQAISLKLFEHIFSSETILQALDYFWSMYKSKNQDEDCLKEQQKSEKCGYLYLFALVQLDKINSLISQKENIKQIKWKALLKHKLKELKQNPQGLKEYCDKEGQYELVCKLFNIQQKPIQKNEHTQQKRLGENKDDQQIEQKKQQQKYQNEQVDKQIQQGQAKDGDNQRNQRIIKMRERMFGKMKGKQQQALKNLSLKYNVSQSQIKQKQDICLICHEHEKQNTNYEHKFVYLGNINRSNTFCTAFYGKQNNIATTLLSSCFHPIHIRCYTKYRQDNKNPAYVYKCPLCEKPSNIVLPYRDDASRQVHNICQNVLATALITNYNIYYHNWYGIYFSHLVESLGLTSLISLGIDSKQLSANSQSDLSKIDQYVINAIDCRKNKNKQQAQQAMTQVIALINQIKNKCKREECMLVQLVIANAVMYRFEIKQNPQQELHTKESPKQKKYRELIDSIKNLKNVLVQQEFQVIFNNVKKLEIIEQEQMGQINDDQNGMEQQKKISLKFRLFSLPLRASDLKTLVNQRNCEKCNDKMSMKRLGQVWAGQICLFCGQMICSECSDYYGHWEQKHSFNKILLRLDTLKVACITKHKIIEKAVYYNELMVPYNLSQQKQLQYELDDFWLWDFKLQRVVSNYLNLQ